MRERDPYVVWRDERYRSEEKNRRKRTGGFLLLVYMYRMIHPRMHYGIKRARPRHGNQVWRTAAFAMVLVCLVGLALVALRWTVMMEGWPGVGLDVSTGGERLGEQSPIEREWTQFVHYGARYLMRMVRDTEGMQGRFIYNLYESGTFKEKSYNVLRHAGTVFAMASYIQWAPRHSTGMVVELDELTEKTAQAVDYLKTAFLKPLIDSNTTGMKALAIWDEPSLISEKTHARRCAKLGGAGLGLVALTSFEAIRPGTTRKNDFSLLAEFIRFMQRDDGSFESKYCDKFGIDDSVVSLFYPGEASLGMVQLYELTKRREYLRIALRGMMYLATMRAESTSVERDHWALLATEKLLKHLHVLRLQDEGEVRQRLLYHGDQVVQSLIQKTEDMLRKTRMNATGNPPMPSHGRTTPTATHLEGLMAAMSFSQKIKELEIRENAYVSARFLVASQIRHVDESNMRHGGIPAAVGRQDTKSKAIRIDYVQHAICGVMHAIDAGIPLLGAI